MVQYNIINSLFCTTPMHMYDAGAYALLSIRKFCLSKVRGVYTKVVEWRSFKGIRLDSEPELTGQKRTLPLR